MARPTMLTRVRHERIINLLRDGVPFATACRAVGVSASAGYEWLYRGWSTHPDRPPTAVYVAFARDVDAVFPGGFAERHGDEDEFAAVTERPNQSSEGTATPERPARSTHLQAHEPFAEPQNRCETGEAAGFSEFPESGEGFAEVAEPLKSDTPRDRARAREQDPMRTTEPESAARRRLRPSAA
jgi:hypothetical protein